MKERPVLPADAMSLFIACFTFMPRSNLLRICPMANLVGKAERRRRSFSNGLFFLEIQRNFMSHCFRRRGSVGLQYVKSGAYHDWAQGSFLPIFRPLLNEKKKRERCCLRTWHRSGTALARADVTSHGATPPYDTACSVVAKFWPSLASAAEAWWNFHLNIMTKMCRKTRCHFPILHTRADVQQTNFSSSWRFLHSWAKKLRREKVSKWVFDLKEKELTKTDGERRKTYV